MARPHIRRSGPAARTRTEPPQAPFGLRGTSVTSAAVALTWKAPRGKLKMVPTDFRSVYQAVLAEWFGTDPSEVLPDSRAGGFAPLARQDASGRNALFDPAK